MQPQQFNLLGWRFNDNKLEYYQIIVNFIQIYAYIAADYNPFILQLNKGMNRTKNKAISNKKTQCRRLR